MDHENVCWPVRKSEISDEQMAEQSWGTERKLTWRHRTIAKLLEDALKESAICRDCKTGELQLLKNESSRNGQGRIWVLQFKRVDCKKNPKRFHISQRSSRFYEIYRALGQSVVVILPLKSFVASLTCLILSAKNLGPDTLKAFLSLWLIASFEATALSFKFFLRPATVLRDIALVFFLVLPVLEWKTRV